MDYEVLHVIIYTRPQHPWMWYPYLILSMADTTSPMYVKRDVYSIIIDAGVYKVFHEWGFKEYPGGYKAWIHKMANFYDNVKHVVKNTWVVIPDYPSDYPNNLISDNVERTIRNIQYALDNYPDVKWIIPLQGKPNSIQSISNMIKKLSDLDLLKSDYVAVAPTCVTKSVDFLKRLAFTVRHLLRDKKIHMFGAIARAWKDISRYVDSTDTITSNFYCLAYIGKKCSTPREHVLGWIAFIYKMFRDGYITKDVYEKVLQNVKINISIREFESIMHLLKTKKILDINNIEVEERHNDLSHSHISNVASNSRA